MRVYLGCPIDQTILTQKSPAEQMQEVADWVIAGLGKDCVIFNPLLAFHNAIEVNHPLDLAYVVRVNEQALELSDLGVFIWNGSPSFGVPIEIRRCFETSKPFFIYDKSGRRPGIYMRACLSGKSRIVDSVEELKHWLRQFAAESVLDSRKSGQIARRRKCHRPAARSGSNWRVHGNRCGE